MIVQQFIAEWLSLHLLLYINSDAHFGMLRMSKQTEFKMVRDMCTCATVTLHVAASRSKGANIAVDTTPYCFKFLCNNNNNKKKTHTHASVSRRAGKHHQEAASTSQIHTSALSNNTRAEQQRINTWTDGSVEWRIPAPGRRRVCQ